MILDTEMADIDHAAEAAAEQLDEANVMISESDPAMAQAQATVGLALEVRALRLTLAWLADRTAEIGDVLETKVGQ